MKKYIPTIIFLICALNIQAQVPKTLSFQGVLVEISNGQAVADGTDYVFDFAIFDVISGGSALWTETHAAVAVEDGVYSVILGSQGSPLTINFDMPYYLEITVSGGPNTLAPETLTPRAALSSSGYELNVAIQDLADGELSGAKIGVGINADNISSGTLPLGRLVDITSAQILDGTITAADISASAGITGAQILDGTITTSDIKSNAAITGGQILDGTLTTSDLSATAGITGSQIADGTLDKNDISTGGIVSSNILDGTITSADISTSAGISGAQILDGTLTTSDLSSSAGITGGQIADGTITTSDLSASAGITSGQIAGLDVAKLSGVIGAANLDDDLDDLADGSLTATKVQYGSNFITTAGTSGQVWKSDGSGAGVWGTDNNTQLSEASVESYIANDVSTSYVPRDNGTKLVSGLFRDTGSNGGYGSYNSSYKFYVYNTGVSYGLVANSNTSSISELYGIYGIASNGSTTNYGVKGYGSGGLAAVGVYGEANSSWGYGGYFTAINNGYGIYTQSLNGGLIRFGNNSGTQVGDITYSGSTVSYNAFTGSHIAKIEGEIPERGYLIRLTGRLSNPGEVNTEPEYITHISNLANDPGILGSYFSIDSSTPDLHLIMSVGNGEMWIVDQGQDLKAGDCLISSNVKGHAMKDQGEFDITYVIARVSENVCWDEISEEVEGIKHKKVSVLFDNFIVNHKAEKLEIELLNLKQEVAEIKALIYSQNQ